MAIQNELSCHDEIWVTMLCIDVSCTINLSIIFLLLRHSKIPLTLCPCPFLRLYFAIWRNHLCELKILWQRYSLICKKAPLLSKLFSETIELNFILQFSVFIVTVLLNDLSITPFYISCLKMRWLLFNNELFERKINPFSILLIFLIG